MKPKAVCYVCSGIGHMFIRWAIPEICPCCKGKEYITAQQWAKYKERQHV